MSSKYTKFVTANPKQPIFEFAQQQVFYKPTSDHPVWDAPEVRNYRPPSLQDLPSSWADVRRLSIDFEAKDPDLKAMGPGVRRKGNYPVGCAIAIEDGPEFYLPMRHEGGDNCDWDVWGYLKDRFKELRRGTILTGAYLPYDLDWGMEYGINFDQLAIKDVQIVDVLINELHMSYSLETLCERYEMPGKDETLLRHACEAFRIQPKDVKRDLWKLPARFVDRYARVDARRPLQILRRQEPIVEKDGLTNIVNLEMKVTPILVKMRRRGVRIDTDRLEQIEQKSLQIEAEMLAKVKHATGIDIGVGNVWKAGALAMALKAAGYHVPKTEKQGKDSVDKDLLKKTGEIGEWLLRARDWNKLRTTFGKQVRDHMVDYGNGHYRVHCTFNQLKATGEENGGKGVRYGRTSCSEYNLQAQPGRHDEFGKLWRMVYVADYGKKFASSDWSQQEPRIGVHYAEILEEQSNGRICPGAREFGDQYRSNPALDVHQALTDIANDPELPRKIVKNFVNGTLYGMGDTKLCHHLHWPTERVMRNGEMKEVPTRESQAKIDKFHRFVPWMRGLTRAAADAANDNGCVWTWLRRRCNFERGPDGKIWKSHKAFNRIGQGSAADQMKATLVACEEEGIEIQMIVHDEFDFSYDDVKQALRVKELQETVVKFRVPMKVDLEVGPSWGEVKEIKEAA